MPVLLELFCGAKSIGKVFDQHGWDVVSVDFNERFEPTICKNVLHLTPENIIDKLPKFGKKVFVIWASPMCTQYSKCRTQGGPRDLVEADALVQKVLDLVNYFDVHFFLEKPHTGLLKSRDVVKGIPVRVIDYCSYADEAFPGRYRKRTGIWTNTDWIPVRALCKPSLCKLCSDGRKHDHACQQRSKLGQMQSSTKQLYRIPSALPEELVYYISGFQRE